MKFYDEDMPAKPTGKDALDFIEEMWTGSKKCPICSNTDWGVNEPASLPAGEGGDLFGRQFPLVPVFCTNCGYAVFFNRIIAGLVELEEDPSPADAAEADK